MKLVLYDSRVTGTDWSSELLWKLDLTMWIYAFEKRLKSLIVGPLEHPNTISKTRAPMSSCAWCLHSKLTRGICGLCWIKSCTRSSFTASFAGCGVKTHKLNSVFQVSVTMFLVEKQQLPVLHQFHLSTYEHRVVSWLLSMILSWQAGQPAQSSLPVRVSCILHPMVLSTDLLDRQHQMLPLSRELLSLDVAPSLWYQLFVQGKLGWILAQCLGYKC